MKPRMKNHFRAHQLSIWLRLIPELHRAGMEDVIARHNMFKNHDDAELYDGPVKPDLIARMTFLDGSGMQRRGGNASDYGEYRGLPSSCLLFATLRRVHCFLLSFFFMARALVIQQRTIEIRPSGFLCVCPRRLVYYDVVYY